MSETREPRLLTFEQLAEQLQVTRRTLERLESAGKIPSVRLGRCVRFDLETVLETLAGDGSGCRGGIPLQGKSDGVGKRRRGGVR